MHLRTLLKVHLMVQTDAKSGPLKHEGKGRLLRAPCDAKESADGTRTNASASALDGILRVHLRIHLEKHLKGAL